MIHDSFQLAGPSPPSILVGHWGYPNVYSGVLLSPLPEFDPAQLDSPERWSSQRLDINQILQLRSQLVLLRTRTNVHRPDKLVQIQQELALAIKPCELEAKLSSRPSFSPILDPITIPIPSKAELAELKLAQNPSSSPKIESVVDDLDLRAEQAMLELYGAGCSVDLISRLLSMGLLGLKHQRRLVPTRWAITAADDLISNQLIQRIKVHPELDEFKLFRYRYLGNAFWVLMIPGPWRFELVEAKFPGSVWNPAGSGPAICIDYELHRGRKGYASNCGGSYYAARLGVAEYLNKLRAQASVLVLREVYDEYWAPLGVWVIREAIRAGLSSSPTRSGSLTELLAQIAAESRLGASYLELSKLLGILSKQSRLNIYR